MNNQPQSVFAASFNKVWANRFTVELHLANIVGGVPADPNIVEGWIRSKVSDNDEMVLQLVAQTMADLGVEGVEGRDAAIAALKETPKGLTVFKADPEDGLYIEGRQLKAGLKEWASIAVNAGHLPSRGWGTTNKGLQSWLAEHIMVVDERIYLGRDVPDRTDQALVHTHRGDSVAYRQVCEAVTVTATVVTDADLKPEHWAAIWTFGELNGLGACRSQGYGRFTVTTWEKQK